MSLHQTLVLLIIALPLAGFLRPRWSVGGSGSTRSGSRSARSSLSWLTAMFVIATFHGVDRTGEDGHRGHALALDPRGHVQVDFGFFVDNLTAVLLIVVTTIGMLVHVYSIGYMRHDPGYWRFFAYLNLFMVSMLLLVLADSWLVLFVAWELVGL